MFNNLIMGCELGMFLFKFSSSWNYVYRAENFRKKCPDIPLNN